MYEYHDNTSKIESPFVRGLSIQSKSPHVDLILHNVNAKQVDLTAAVVVGVGLAIALAFVGGLIHLTARDHRFFDRRCEACGYQVNDLRTCPECGHANESIGGLRMIDTAQAKRRTLRFNSIDDLRRDLDAIEKSHAAGTLKHTGNWTEGEIFTHLAAFINYGYEGYPKEICPPWLLSVLFIRPKRKAYLRDGLPAGFKIPRTAKGTVGMQNVPFDVGLRQFRDALDRLEKAEPPIESPAFGPMCHADKIGFALRHAELHLGFLHP